MTADDEMFRWAQRCISGEITPNMRMVVLRIEERRVTFRYYLDIEPNSFLLERAEIIALNFDCGLSTNLDALDIELIHTVEPLGKLEYFDGSLFRRWENDQGTTEPDE
ncbi:hypothetical protein [Albibacillus kandeliae]|uniref:hypothetical protein n=1 Tax=Albibacillus kandeliae TaxID=2174228 RepID=UPI000D697312|nr:hypothetical protein [Albibacillus kandeliae]